MRILTENQKDVLSCLEVEFLQLKDICYSYGLIQHAKGFERRGSVWKNEVSSCLKSLIVRGLVEYEYIGKYKLKEKNVQ